MQVIASTPDYINLQKPLTNHYQSTVRSQSSSAHLALGDGRPAVDDEKRNCNRPHRVHPPSLLKRPSNRRRGDGPRVAHNVIQMVLVNKTHIFVISWKIVESWRGWDEHGIQAAACMHSSCQARTTSKGNALQRIQGVTNSPLVVN